MMGEERSPARIIVADDHALMRSAFVSILSYGRNLEVVGEAGDGREAVAMCEKLRPDLVLMDISMPVMDGIEATSQLKERLLGIVVLVVTAHEDEDLMLRAIRAGAAGYVLKGDDPSRLISAVSEALGGESPMDPRLSAKLLRRLAAEEVSSGRRIEADVPTANSPISLTPRELEVLGDGWSLARPTASSPRSST